MNALKQRMCVNMASKMKYLLVFLLLDVTIDYSFAAVHNHNFDISNNVERESDGSYRARDYDHYSDAGHNSEFDHEAIIGSVREAEEFDQLSPEEAEARLASMLPKMDLNRDQLIDRIELKKWILNSFVKLSREEAEERMLEADDNRDGHVTWPEYLQDAFGVDSEHDVGEDDSGETGMLLQDEKVMWMAADADGNGVLTLDEFTVFSNPEEHESMQQLLINQTMRDKDTNHDGYIDFHEYIAERGGQQDKEWMLTERDKFDHELDNDHDGKLSVNEVYHWIIPDNDEIAEEEVEHLFDAADDNHDGKLTFAEVLAHREVFVGGAPTASDLDSLHLADEL